MVIHSIGNFKIHQKSKHKNDYTLICIIVLYTLFVIFLKGLWDSQYRCENVKNDSTSLPLIFLITPTYYRPNQIPELIRIKQALQNVVRIYWIIVEDSDIPTKLMNTFVKSLDFDCVHLYVSTPIAQKVNFNDPNKHWKHHRGILQRNLGLEWLRQNFGQYNEGDAVLYFMDDDNTYDKQIFKEMRFTKRISVWPVGLVGGLMVEKPIIHPRTGSVIGFNSMWSPSTRKFPLDMSAFALNLKTIMGDKTKVIFNEESEIGEVESDFLTALDIRLVDLEPKADYCRRVFVWHTKAWPPKLTQEKRLNEQGKRSDEGMILI